MIPMAVMVIVSILLVVSYVGITILRKRELPDSISAMVYDLPEGGWRWLWSVWLILVDILTFAPVIGVLDGKGLGFMGFLTMVMLAFVAVWPLCDESHKRWHYILGIASGVLSQACMAVVSTWWLLLWLLMPAMWVAGRHSEDCKRWIDGKAVFVAEMLCWAVVELSNI